MIGHAIDSHMIHHCLYIHQTAATLHPFNAHTKVALLYSTTVRHYCTALLYDTTVLVARLLPLRFLRNSPNLPISQATARLLHLRDYDPAFIVVYKASSNHERIIFTDSFG